MIRDKGRDGMLVKNCMEELVWSFLDEVLKNYPDVCNCEICRSDIIALTLNKLPPKYIATSKGEIYTRIEALHYQFEADILSALVKSIEIVEKNPRHNNLEQNNFVLE